MNPVRLLRSRWAWGVAAGVMFALAQPKFELAGFAWVAPAVLLLATLGATPRETFRVGYVAGLTQQLITLYWLLFIPFPAGAIAGWLALSAYLALYPALWCLAAWKMFPLTLRGPLFDPTPTDHFTETSLFQRLIWSLFCACAWVMMEMLATRLLGGFPWNFLGISQFRMLPLIQISQVTGVYGVSFLMAWFACTVFSAAMNLTRDSNRSWPVEILPPIAAIVALIFFGFSHIQSRPSSERHVRVALVQPSIPQDLIFDSRANTNRFKQLIQLSELALNSKPQILIWPEAAVPTMLRYDTNTSHAIINLVTNNNVWAIIGSDDAAPRSADPLFVPESEKDFFFYNSAFAISPNGELMGIYRKRLLVIFGEFVPFTEWLPFMKYLTPVGENSFSRGEGPAPFTLHDLDVTTSALICFEDTFPEFVRAYVREDTDFLLNMTNNGWFGESAAQWQHAAAAVFRAIENQIPLVRCANNGLTCWVDQVGRLREVHVGDEGNIYSAGFTTAEIPLLGPNQKRALTFYTRHGDVFGWTCTGLALAAISFRSRRKCRASTSNTP